MASCNYCMHKVICNAHGYIDADECSFFVDNADVEEVVRCGNCKHSNEDGTICHYNVGRAVEPEHFCSYGVRKNENSN